MVRSLQRRSTFSERFRRGAGSGSVRMSNTRTGMLFIAAVFVFLILGDMFLGGI